MKSTPSPFAPQAMGETSDRTRKAIIATARAGAFAAARKAVEMLPGGVIFAVVMEAAAAGMQAYRKEGGLSDTELVGGYDTQEVVAGMNEELADQPIPETTKAVIRQGVLSELDRLIAKLEALEVKRIEDEKERARQAVQQQTAKREQKLAELQAQLMKQLDAAQESMHLLPDRRYKQVYRIATEILDLDPANKDARKAEAFAVQYVEENRGMFGRTCLVFVVILCGYAWFYREAPPSHWGALLWEYLWQFFIAVSIVTFSNPVWVKLPLGIRSFINGLASLAALLFLLLSILFLLGF